MTITENKNNDMKKGKTKIVKWAAKKARLKVKKVKLVKVKPADYLGLPTFLEDLGPAPLMPELLGASQPMFENEITKKYGLMATCNACDRIIFEDENWREQYIENGGYCKDCKTIE